MGWPASCSLLGDTLCDTLCWKLQHLQLIHEPGHRLQGTRCSAENSFLGPPGPFWLSLQSAPLWGVPFLSLGSSAPAPTV